MAWGTADVTVCGDGSIWGEIESVEFREGTARNAECEYKRSIATQIEHHAILSSAGV